MSQWYSLGWFGVLGIYIFFVIGTVINKFIMGPIVTYIYKKEKREGDFRSVTSVSYITLVKLEWNLC